MKTLNVLAFALTSVIVSNSAFASCCVIEGKKRCGRICMSRSDGELSATPTLVGCHRHRSELCCDTHGRLLDLKSEYVEQTAFLKQK